MGGISRFWIPLIGGIQRAELRSGTHSNSSITFILFGKIVVPKGLFKEVSEGPKDSFGESFGPLDLRRNGTRTPVGYLWR